MSLEQLLTGYTGGVLSLARCICGRRVRVIGPETLMQEMCLRHVKEARPRHMSLDEWMTFLQMEFPRVLISLIRKQDALKRGNGAAPMPLEGDHPDLHEFVQRYEIEPLEAALAKLRSADPQQHQIVILYIVKMPLREIAEYLGVEAQQVMKAWRHAKAWLRDELSK